MRAFRNDTAATVRPCDLIRHDGRTLLVTSTAAAPIAGRPSRLAVEAWDPASGAEVTVWLDAGEPLPVHRASSPTSPEEAS